MVRKRFRLVSIVLLGLTLSHIAASPSLADGAPSYSRDSAGALSSEQQVATADVVTGLSQASAAAGTVEPSKRSLAQPTGRLIDYPALALLAIAIICMAALSRRDAEVGLKEGYGYREVTARRRAYAVLVVSANRAVNPGRRSGSPDNQTPQNSRGRPCAVS
jgi:hypothetical protein